MYGTGGRYNLLIYNSNYVVLRRCLIRHDGGWTDSKGDPEAGTNAYSSSQVYYQNCIILDSNLTNYHNWYAPFYGTADGSESTVSWDGCIALNNRNAGFQLDPKSGASLNNIVIKNSVSYNNGWGITLGSQGTVSGTIENVTIGSVDSNDAIAKWGSGGSVSVKNAIIYKIGGSAFRGVSGKYSDTYNCGDNGSGTGVVHMNPETSGLLYLTRVENGTALKTAGESSSQVGANIQNKIGTSGTLYGESGWNTITSAPLWPFPNENRIKTDLASVSTRNFAGSSKTLTQYVWGFIGNPTPSDISVVDNGSSTGGNTPEAPQNLHIVSVN
jgi:hypothetical protein